MSKKYGIFITALFCAFLGLFLAANLLTPDREFSPVENRYLQQRPTPTLKTLVSGKFMSQFERYTTDQFVLRDAWTGLKSRAEVALGKRENNGVYLCAGDTLITRYDAPDPGAVAENLGHVDAFAEKAGVPVYFSLIPGAVSIWDDRLPQGAPNADQGAVLEQAAASVPHANWYDTGGLLRQHRDEDVFYRTDHHWTSLGAYYGYAALMEALGLTPVPLASYTAQTVSGSFYGTAYSTSGIHWIRPDSIQTYVPDEGVTVTSYTYDGQGRPTEEARALYVKSFLEEKDKYAMFLGGNQSLCVVRTPNTSAPKLLIVRDSYADSLVPFLTPHFSEIHLVDLRYYKGSISGYIEENGIGAALVLYSVANFTSDGNLAWLDR